MKSGLDFKEDGMGIDSTITCVQDFWDGRTLSDIPHGEVSGAHLRPEEKVAEDGATAVYYAAVQVMSGRHDTVLVVATTKESQTERNIIENFGLDPIYLQPLGMDYLSAAALQANRYMDRFGITRQQCAMVVVKNRSNAFRNPFAQQPMKIRIEDVIESETVSYPLSRLDIKPTSDGSCGLILTTESKAKKWSDKPVWIKGMGNCYDTHYPGDRELSRCDALRKAASMAYRMASIDNPVSEIDVIELSEHFSYQELLWMEGLGLCGSGEGGRFIESGITQFDGSLPVNPSGGVISGNPVGVAGMVRVIEAVLQLRGEAGERQIEGVKTALAHGVGGPCGQHHCVLILER
jgi:acetyl-CoA C-acetyltransferase